MEAGDLKLPVVAGREGNISCTWRYWGWRTALAVGYLCVGPAAAMLSHDSYGVAVEPQFECVDKEKSVWMMLHSLGVIFFLEAGRQDPVLG